MPALRGDELLDWLLAALRTIGVGAALAGRADGSLKLKKVAATRTLPDVCMAWLPWRRRHAAFQAG